MPTKMGLQPSQMRLTLGTERHVFSVQELNSSIQHLFEGEFCRIWVAGEISGCRLATSGHYYFSLKDAESQIKCALFKGSARSVRFKPQEGLAVIARGSLEVYSARGEYQLIIEQLELQGAGSLQAAFEQLKVRLAAEGLFQPERKRPLPVHPRRIGLITSPDGAVLQDMLQVLERRFPGLHLRLYPSQVQGEGSVEQLCVALQHFGSTSWAHVIIVARGGGSQEDLWSFNDERVARAIAASPIPVISAVGHETDFTIADFVADHRSPTPSAAAEIVVCTRDSLLLQLKECSEKMTRAFRYRLIVAARDVQSRSIERTHILIGRSITRRMQRVDEADAQLRNLQSQVLDKARRRLTQFARRVEESNLPLRFARNRHRQELLQQRLLAACNKSIHAKASQLNSGRAHLTQLSPLSVLERGYAIVEKRSGQILRSSSDAAVGEQVRVRLHRGELEAEVTSSTI